MVSVVSVVGVAVVVGAKSTVKVTWSALTLPAVMRPNVSMLAILKSPRSVVPVCRKVAVISPWDVAAVQRALIVGGVAVGVGKIGMPIKPEIGVDRPT